MSYASLMVSLSLSDPNERLLETATALASRHGAVLIGVAAADFSAPLYYATGDAAQRIVDERIASIIAQQQALETVFKAAVAKAGCTGVWRAAIDFPSDYVAHHARAADLVLCSTPRAGDPSQAVDPADLVLRLGRPLLVVPAAAPADLSHVLVAWKDTPEARRAAGAALPLLRTASTVTVVAIAEDAEQRASTRDAADDVVAWLGRHRISARAVVSDATGETLAQLDAAADACQAGVIVAGAYGHSRLREWAIGGVTKHLLTQQKRAVFLMH